MQTAALTSLAPMLIARNAKQSAEFYRDMLGFEIDFVYEGCIPNQPNYAVVKRNGLEVHFESYEHDQAGIPEGRVKCGTYFMVDDVDSLHDEFLRRGVAVKWPPTNQGYGIRDFKIFDCDGYQLLFGSLIKTNKIEPGGSANPPSASG